MDIRVYCTERDPAEIELVKQTLQTSARALAHHVSFCRPDFHELLPGLMRSQLKDAMAGGADDREGHSSTMVWPSRTSHLPLPPSLSSASFQWSRMNRDAQVTFCGSPTVSRVCHQAVSAANALTEAVGLPDRHFLFRTEFNGYAARRPVPSGSPESGTGTAKPPDGKISRIHPAAPEGCG